MKVNNFDVLKTMSDRNLDLRLAPNDNFIEAQMNGEYGWIKMGVDAKTVTDLLTSNNIVMALLVWDKSQFEQVHKELARLLEE